MAAYSSQLLENAVNQFASLPGVGSKTALRFVLNLLRRSESEVDDFAQVISKLKHEVHYCRECHNLSDAPVCTICANARRDHSTICVVENIRDVMAIENTQQYQGIYHVLGGVISPIDGIGPDNIEVESLVSRAMKPEVKEVIFALPTTMEGDTTCFYLYRKIAPRTELKITTIARGVAVGNELQYADEITLGKSLQNRTVFQQ
ncbi:MAG TPA: recombination protein RecR [Bacteroidales bacterium]|nr:recombination protein RecR [Bacteroidales bacterium]